MNQILKEAGVFVDDDHIKRDFGLLNNQSYIDFCSSLFIDGDEKQQKEVDSMAHCLQYTTPRNDYGEDYEQMKKDFNRLKSKKNLTNKELDLKFKLGGRLAVIRQEARKNPDYYTREWQSNGAEISNNNLQYVEFRHRCKNRACPVCSKVRQKKNKNSIMKYFEYHKKTVIKKYVDDTVDVRLFHLTYKNVKTREELRNCFKSVTKDMNRFKSLLKRFGYSINCGVQVIETTYNKKGEIKQDTNNPNKFYTVKSSSYHPHIHAMIICDEYDPTDKQKKAFQRFINDFNKKYSKDKYCNEIKFIDGTYPTFCDKDFEKAFSVRGRKTGRSYKGYIDGEILKCIWKYANHSDSHVSKIERATQGIGGGISYISKYISKGSFDYKLPISANLDIYYAMKNVRILQRFGQFKGFSLQKLTKKILYHKDDVGNIFPFIYNGRQMSIEKVLEKDLKAIETYEVT
jgi:hypothetical protein